MNNSYIKMYEELIPQLDTKGLLEQKKLFEANLRIGEHPTDKHIYKLICDAL